MSNTLGGPQRHQKHQQRLAWLRARPELLARLPGAKGHVDRAQLDALDEAVRQMKHVRLYAPTTTPVNVRWGIRLLVSELRGQVVAKDQRFKAEAP